jgi:uncharacterized membrane protein
VAALAAQTSKADAVIENIYTGLLVTIFLVITWFSVYVVYKLFHGQR